ncbi:MAG TPA: hypothetical protein VFI31_05775 [Pirellulales bacterium]|nr:hypothetical protein [Pirellulales bacterium]
MAFDPYHKWLGIPAAEQPPNHYRLLAVALFEDDPEVIETAADQRMALLRTFQTGEHSPLSQKLLNELSAARLCLLTPEKKSAYDGELRHRIDAAQPAPLAVPAARAIMAAPAQPWIPMAAAVDQAPMFAMRCDTISHVMRKRTRRLGPVSSSCLALVVMAAPLYIGYLLYKRSVARPAPQPQQNGQTVPELRAPPRRVGFSAFDEGAGRPNRIALETFENASQEDFIVPATAVLWPEHSRRSPHLRQIELRRAVRRAPRQRFCRLCAGMALDSFVN